MSEFVSGTIIGRLKEMHGEKFDVIVDKSTQLWISHIDDVMCDYIKNIGDGDGDNKKMYRYNIQYYSETMEETVDAPDQYSAAYKYITGTDYAASYYILKKEYFDEYVAYLREQDYFNFSKSLDEYLPEYIYNTLRYVSIDLTSSGPV
jgi:hypothetical protein